MRKWHLIAALLLSLAAVPVGLSLFWVTLKRWQAISEAVEGLHKQLEELTGELLVLTPNYSTTITTGDPEIDIQISVDCTTVPEDFLPEDPKRCAKYFQKLINDARETFPNPVTTGG